MISHNAKLYNAPDTVYYKTALRFEKGCLSFFGAMEKQLPAVEFDPHHLGQLPASQGWATTERPEVEMAEASSSVRVEALAPPATVILPYQSTRTFFFLLSLIYFV